MPKPIVTVVMAVHNEARYVGDAIRCILAQTFTDFEFIIVDDGSRDDSVRIVASFSDPRLRLVRQENAGLANALNRGIVAARGEYIARQDADDLCEPDRLAVQIDALKGDRSLVLVGTNAVLVDENGEELSRTDLPQRDDAIRAVLSDPQVRNAFVHGSVVFRRAAAVDAGLYRSQFRYAQDYDFWLRLREHGTLRNLAEPKYLWRLRREGVGATKYDLQREYATIAFRAARCREAGRPEPPVMIQLEHASWLQKLLRAARNVPEGAAYDMALAKMLLTAGRIRRGRAHAVAVFRARPWSVHALLLIVVSFLPQQWRGSVWERLRRGYRYVISR